MTILIAEDDLVCRKLLCRFVKGLGHRVVQAENGLMAWDLWLEYRSPLIISDWLMPDMSGIELCQKIRSFHQNKYTYIIMITSMSGKENHLQAMDAGVDDFMNKPFDRDCVYARIRVAQRILNMQKEINTLSGLLPICTYCKNIRDDQNYWQRVEAYIERNSDVRFSHGVCPDCYEKYLKPQMVKLKSSKPSQTKEKR
jgi:sigma-B regulation protein RsbU (phosphoserine phosphatase)